MIPKGTEVLLPFGLMSRDVEEWGDPIDAFDPDRYLTAGPGGTLAPPVYVKAEHDSDVLWSLS